MIRPFEDKDLTSLLNIWYEVNIKENNFIDAKYYEDNLQAIFEMLPKSTVYIYEENNEILGFIGTTSDYLEGIFVKNRSSKIAKELLDYVKNNVDRLITKVYKQNTFMLKFYMHENFVALGEEICGDTKEINTVLVYHKM